MPEGYSIVVEAVLASESGPWPEGRGLNDEGAWFVAARSFVLPLIAAWRARQNKGAANVG